MDSRIALIGIIVEDKTHVAQLNEILATYSEYIIGRMGIPYKERSLNIISLVLDAPNDVINTVSGKLGKLKGITSKTMYSKI